MLYQATRAAPLDGQLTLIKNDRDSRNNVYGAQENYEVLVARGWRLFCWRLGLILLLPLMLFSWLSLLLQVVLLLSYLLLAGLCYGLVRPLLKTAQRFQLLRILFGEDIAHNKDDAMPLAGWMETLQVFITVILVSPLAICLLLLVRTTAFRSIQRQLAPFLISRSMLAGSGTLTGNGDFHLADKADAINCLVGFCSLWNDRPILSIGHFFKSACIQAWHSPADYFRLFATRQRLQIALGDSNMSPEAEYLRIATTMLVIQAIEAGQLSGFPQVWRPIQALKHICHDPFLTATVSIVGKGRWTGLRTWIAAAATWPNCSKFPKRPSRSSNVGNRYSMP